MRFKCGARVFVSVEAFFQQLIRHKKYESITHGREVTVAGAVVITCQVVKTQ